MSKAPRRDSGSSVHTTELLAKIDVSNGLRTIDFSKTFKPLDLSKTFAAFDVSASLKPIDLSKTFKPRDLSKIFATFDVSNAFKAIDVSRSVATYDFSKTFRTLEASNAFKTIDLSKTLKTFDLSNFVVDPGLLRATLDEVATITNGFVNEGAAASEGASDDPARFAHWVLDLPAVVQRRLLLLTLAALAQVVAYVDAAAGITQPAHLQELINALLAVALLFNEFVGQRSDDAG